MQLDADELPSELPRGKSRCCRSGERIEEWPPEEMADFIASGHHPAWLALMAKNLAKGGAGGTGAEDCLDGC
nr:hypothetical protein [Streptosporangium sp. NBC_01469]